MVCNLYVNNVQEFYLCNVFPGVLRQHCADYFLTVVTGAIFSVSWVITKDQRLAEWSLLYISNIFLNTLAVPNNVVFCITPFQSTYHILSLTLPKAAITTGTTFFSFYNLQVLVPFPLFFPRSYISWYTNINDYPLSLFLVNYNYVWFSCLYHIVTLNIDISQQFYVFIFNCSF